MSRSKLPNTLVRQTKVRRLRSIRRVLVEQLEDRRLLASDWQNEIRPADVNQSGDISPLDAVLLVNELNSPTLLRSDRSLPPLGNVVPPPFFDVNGDSFLSPIDILLTVNSLNRIGPPPAVTGLSLSNDSASFGTQNSDLRTNSPSISGQATDIDNFIQSIEFQLDSGTFQPATIGSNRTFVINPGLPLDGSADGLHIIRVRATDETNNVSNIRELSFTLDTIGPTKPTIALAASSDTLPIGDQQTSNGVIDLVGTTSPNMPLRLAPGTLTTTSDASGKFTFSSVPLALGPNSFTVSASDEAGNLNSSPITVTRIADAAGPTIQVNGPLSRTSNSNIVITGTVTVGAAGADKLFGQVDLGDVFPVTFSPTGVFSFTTSLPVTGAGDGQHLVRIRAEDARGNQSPLVTVNWTLDTVRPAASSTFTGVVRSQATSIEVQFSEVMAAGAYNASSFSLVRTSGANSGVSIPISAVTEIAGNFARIALANPMDNESYRLTLSAAVSDLAGNRTAPTVFDFTVAEPTHLSESSPASGEEMVSLTRETIIRFSSKVDPGTITPESFYLIANGDHIPGHIRVSPTELFATFFYDTPLPSSTEVRIVVDGTKIKGRDGLQLDADNDGEPGGLLKADFRTLPVALIPGTSIWGYIYDSYNTAPQEKSPIAVPTGDPQFDPKSTGAATIPFTRAEYFPTTGQSTNDPRLQPNVLSSYMDASMVYGSDEVRARALRRIDGTGKLKTTDNNLLPTNDTTFFPDGVLAIDNKGTAPTSTLPVAGDVRAAESPALVTLHTLFVREHNRKASEIKAAHPNYSDEAIYQEARRWVTALIQQITYQEYLPSLIGPNILPAYSGYKPTVDASVSAIFSTAAFRLGHTQQGSDIQRLDASGKSLAGGSLSLRDAFFNPTPIQTDGIDPFLRGLIAKQAQEIDLKMVDDLRNFLFGPPGSGGMDLASINIERGRDLGLPDYNQARADFGLPKVTGFSQITGNAALAAALQAVYGSVDKVDVWVGGLAEDHISGADVGPLFAAIIKDQFLRSRDGNRFWYENGQLTTVDLAAVRNVKLSDIIQRNTGLSGVPSNVFTTSNAPAGPGAGGTAANGSTIEVPTYDGYGNNIADPLQGRVGQPLLTNYTVSYGDGKSSPAGANRPGARSVSNSLFSQSGQVINSRGLTELSVTWGQFIAHDFDFTPVQAVKGTDIPVVGATISLDALPSISATTDKFGFFELKSPDGLPAPEFFVHIDGSTAINAPAGAKYATLGKPFHTIPGQRTQLSMSGATFNVYLPPMSMGDIVTLNPNADTVVGFGPAAQAEIRAMFANDPVKAQKIIDTMKVTYPAGAAQSESGVPATRATIIPVSPDRLPAPLPPGANPSLVISVQAGTAAGFNLAGGSTNFDTPAPASFPNLDGLAPGEKSLIWSFDHDAGKWIVVGVATVNSIGDALISDVGNGVLAPGWHFIDQGSPDKKRCPGANPPWYRVFDVAKAVTSCVSAAASKLAESLKTASEILKQITDIAKRIEDVRDAYAVSGNAAVAKATLEGIDKALSELLGKAARELGKNSPAIQGIERAISCAADVFTALDKICKDITNNGKCGTTITRTLCEGVSQAKFLFSNTKDLFSALQGKSEQVVARLSQLAFKKLFDFICDQVNKTGGQGEGEPPNVDVSLFNETLSRLSIAQASLSDYASTTDFIKPIEDNAIINERLAQEIEETHDAISDAWYSVEYDRFTLRGRANSRSQINFVLPAKTQFTLTVYDRAHNRIADFSGVSEASGVETEVPVLIFSSASTLPDFDGDGLADRAEFAIGANAHSADTDGDGIDDLSELEQGLSPLGERSIPTGIVTSIPIKGDASAISFSQVLGSANRIVGFAASGSHGLAVVDASNFQSPIILGQLKLSGNSQDLAIDQVTSTVIVASHEGGLHFVDFSDPMLPREVRTINVPATQVEILDGVAFVSSASRISVYDPLSGDLLNSQILPSSSTITGMTHEGNLLYTMDADRLLRVFEATDAGLTARGSKQLTNGAGKISVSDGIVYAAATSFDRGGFVTVDVSNPDNIFEISGSDVVAPFVAPSSEIVPNGSGLGLLLGPTVGQNLVDLMQVSDPANTNIFLTRFSLTGSPSSAAIASGIAYVAAGNSLQVINYVGFDNQGLPPTVTATGPIGNTIQEGALVPIRVSVTDDVQVRNVELLMNGTVVASDVSAPFDLSPVAPALAAGITQVEFQVRAYDTGGNVGLSNKLTYKLITDQTPPHIVSSSPSADGAGFRVSAITLRFNEPIDPDKLSLANATLTNFGANFQAGGGDDTTVAINRIESPSPRRVVVYMNGPLPEGRFQLTIDKSSISDVASNFIEADETLVFTSFDLDEANSIAWNTDSNGDWNDPSNWNTGSVPGPNDQVIIDRKTASPVITISSGDIRVRSLNVRDGIALNGGSLTVSDVAEVQGTFAIHNGATLRADGRKALFTVNGEADLDGGSFEVTNGGRIQFPAVTQYTHKAGTVRDTVVFRATGQGSLLDLRNIQTLTGGDGLNDQIAIEALAGGTVNLSGVTDLIDAAAGDTRGRAMLIRADGSNSVVNLSALRNFLDRDNTAGFNVSGLSSLTAVAGGTINVPQLKALSAVSLNLDNTTTLPINQITTMTNGELNITSGNQVFSNLTNLSGQSINLSGGSVDLSRVDNANGASFVVSGGRTLALPALASYTHTVGTIRDTVVLRATGQGSVLDLRNIQTLTGGDGLNDQIAIEALAGGIVNLSGVTDLIDAPAGDTRGRAMLIRADGSNSVVNLSALRNFLDRDNTSGFNVSGLSSLTAVAGGTINVPQLKALSAVSLNLDSTGTLPINQITTMTNGELNITSGNQVFGNLTTLSGQSINLSGGSVDLSHVDNANGASFVVSSGRTLALPALATYTHTIGTIRDTVVFRATGQGSLLDLRNIQTLTGGDGLNDQIAIEALAGGTVNLSGITDLIDAPAGDTRGRAMLIRADGSNSVVNLSALRNFLDRDSTAGFNVSGLSLISAERSARVILSPIETVLSNVTVTVTSNGSITGNYINANLIAATIPKLESSEVIDDKSAQWLFDFAIGAWRSALVEASDSLLSRLNLLNLVVTDLQGATLGSTVGTTVYLDRNAAGWGWFIDLTPSDDGEFKPSFNEWELRNEAAEMDVLTVLLHEIGHSIGLAHSLDLDGDEYTLMQDALRPGTRRKISSELADFVFNNWK